MIANGKHYLLNNQEDNRWFGSNDADIRTIMEMYLPPFEGAVKAGIGSLMCRYGKRPFLEPFYTKNDQFTKTGSGRT